MHMCRSDIFFSTKLGRELRHEGMLGYMLEWNNTFNDIIFIISRCLSHGQEHTHVLECQTLPAQNAVIIPVVAVVFDEIP